MENSTTTTASRRKLKAYVDTKESSGICWHEGPAWARRCPIHPARECAVRDDWAYCGKCRAWYDRNGIAVEREDFVVERRATMTMLELAGGIGDW